MWAVAIVLCSTSLILLYSGYCLVSKRDINTIHSKNHKYVKPEDVKSYTFEMGMAQYLMGICFLLSSYCLAFTDFSWSLYPVIASAVVSFLIMTAAQKKYNGGWAKK